MKKRGSQETSEQTGMQVPGGPRFRQIVMQRDKEEGMLAGKVKHRQKTLRHVGIQTLSSRISWKNEAETVKQVSRNTKLW